MSMFKRLIDGYRFPGFTPDQNVKGIFGDPNARVITLHRTQKKHSVQSVMKATTVSMIISNAACAICLQAMHAYIWIWTSGVSSVESVTP
jgi:hypothetical protein